MYSIDGLKEEPTPDYVQGVFAPELQTAFWVFSDFELGFDGARSSVAKFLAKCARQSQHYWKVSDLPPEVILVVAKDGQVAARGLLTPRQLEQRRARVAKQKGKLAQRLQPKQ